MAKLSTLRKLEAKIRKKQRRIDKINARKKLQKDIESARKKLSSMGSKR